jgi:CysZ protein
MTRQPTSLAPAGPGRGPGATPRLRPPSFWEGATALPRGVRFILERPRCWPAASTPVIVFILLAVPVLWLSIAEFGPWLGQSLLPHAHSWYGESARVLLSWVAAAAAAFVGLWLALLLSPALSAPALERLVRERERELGAPVRAPQSFWFEVRCGLAAQVGGLVLALPLWLLYWALAALLPGAGLVLFPLQVLPLALGLAWNLLDYPLTLRGIRVRQRWALLRSRPAPILGFGAGLALLFWIPGAALVLLPAGVVAATDVAWRLLPDSGDSDGGDS